MSLAKAINEAPENHLDDLVSFVMSEFAVGSTDEDSKFEKADHGEVVSALKAWAYMHQTDPSGGE